VGSFAVSEKENNKMKLPVVIASGFLSLGMIHAQKSDDSKKVVEKDIPPAATGKSAGSRVFIDPATKEVREPGAEDMRALDTGRERVQGRSALPRGNRPQTIRHPSGAIGLSVGRSSMTSVTAVRNADGSVSLACAADENAAKSEATKPVSKKVEERLDVQ
jgi:hypothetical protein